MNKKKKKMRRLLHPAAFIIWNSSFAILRLLVDVNENTPNIFENYIKLPRHFYFFNQKIPIRLN